MGAAGRVAVAASLVVLCAAGAPAVAAAPVELRGVTVIHGSRGTYVDVRLPKSVTLATPIGDSPDLGVAGLSRLAAFVLVGTDARTRGVTIAGGKTAAGRHAHEFLLPVREWPARSSWALGTESTYGATTSLPAGHYRLYVVSNGPATFFLTLRGLSGSRIIRAEQPAAVVKETMYDSTYTPPAQRAYYGTSGEATLPRRGFAIHTLQARTDAEAAWQVTMCRYDGGAAPVAPAGVLLRCPEGDSAAASHRPASAEPDDTLFVQASAGLPPGPHGLGATMTTASAGTVFSYSAFWLAY